MRSSTFAGSYAFESDLPAVAPRLRGEGWSSVPFGSYALGSTSRVYKMRSKPAYRLNKETIFVSASTIRRRNIQYAHLPEPSAGDGRRAPSLSLPAPVRELQGPGRTASALRCARRAGERTHQSGAWHLPFHGRHQAAAPDAYDVKKSAIFIVEYPSQL